MKTQKFTIGPSVGDLKRTKFTLAKGDRVVVGDNWNYHLATVVGFGKTSVKVKFAVTETRNLGGKTVSFDEYGWQWGTRGNYGWRAYSLDEGFARIEDDRVTYRERVIKFKLANA